MFTHRCRSGRRSLGGQRLVFCFLGPNAVRRRIRHVDMGMGQNESTREPQVLVLVSIYQSSIGVPILGPQPNVMSAVF